MPVESHTLWLLNLAIAHGFDLTQAGASPKLPPIEGKNIMIELVQKRGEVLLGFIRDKSLGDYCARLLLRTGVGVLVIGMCLVLGGCARELTAYGRARQADTIEAYEEFIRTNPGDPRVRYARRRVEVLRLLEVQRSGSVGIDGGEKMAPQERDAARAQPGYVQPVPWNLTAELPRSSTFTLDLHYGCLVPVPHVLGISQTGERITYTLEHGYESRLIVYVPLPQFVRFWETVVSSDVGSMKSSHGRMGSTGAYRGQLLIEIDTGTRRFSRKILLEGVNFEDKTLTRLLNSMAELHPKDHRMPLFR